MRASTLGTILFIAVRAVGLIFIWMQYHTARRMHTTCLLYLERLKFAHRDKVEKFVTQRSPGVVSFHLIIGLIFHDFFRVRPSKLICL